MLPFILICIQENGVTELLVTPEVGVDYPSFEENEALCCVIKIRLDGLNNVQTITLELSLAVRWHLAPEDAKKQESELL